LFLLFVQDIGHAHGAYKPPRESMSRTLLSLAGFQVIISGRFCVIAEGLGKSSFLGGALDQFGANGFDSRCNSTAEPAPVPTRGFGRGGQSFACQTDRKVYLLCGGRNKTSL
jgi:hypothetical protein